jgi:hypothetical protein
MCQEKISAGIFSAQGSGRLKSFLSSAASHFSQNTHSSQTGIEPFGRLCQTVEPDRRAAFFRRALWAAGGSSLTGEYSGPKSS